MANEVVIRSWEAKNEKAVLLLVHGLGGHIGRWDFTAQYFQAKGYASYALALRGFGESSDLPRGYINSFQTYYQDIFDLADKIKKEKPGKKIFIVGESFGALLSFVAAVKKPAPFSGLILLSPAFKNGMRFSPFIYLKVAFLAIFNQQAAIPMPFTAAMCTRDVNYQKVMERDQRELRTASVRFLLNFLLEGLRAQRMIKNLQLPLLMLIAGQDQLVDEKESRKLFKKMPLADKQLIEYPEYHHALSIELGREKIFGDILRWLESRSK